jgi:hypothetical protein
MLGIPFLIGKIRPVAGHVNVLSWMCLSNRTRYRFIKKSIDSFMLTPSSSNDDDGDLTIFIYVVNGTYSDFFGEILKFRVSFFSAHPCTCTLKSSRHFVNLVRASFLRTVL